MRAAAPALVALALLVPRAADAGGLELPDNGTEALARGGAFVAKADDGTALEYNPAGFARQRGTRALVDGHLVLSSFTFQRAGAYPDDPTSGATPWGGRAFPAAQNTGGPFFAPFLAASSDFGTDWLTVALGVFGPSAVGNRTFPLGISGMPSPSRYDAVQTASTIAYPTVAAGVRVSPGLDLGVSVHLVTSHLSLTSVSFVDLGDGKGGPCPNPEYQPCDSVSRLDVSGMSWGATFGALGHLSDDVTLGASLRTPIAIDASGSATVLVAPLGQPIPPAGHATFHMDLPWVFRLGARRAWHEGAFEVGDVEFDTTYETWGQAQGDGPHVHLDHLGPASAAFDAIDIDVVHHYGDTFSLRAGGAYNVRTSAGVLSLRAGAYYDKSATANDPGYTRVDVDTLDKIAGTLGVGLRVGSFTFNLAYAEVFEPDRIVAVGEGQVRPLDGAAHGAPVDAQGAPLPAVNEGRYSAHTQIISMSVAARLDDLFGGMP